MPAENCEHGTRQVPMTSPASLYLLYSIMVSICYSLAASAVTDWQRCGDGDPWMICMTSIRPPHDLVCLSCLAFGRRRPPSPGHLFSRQRSGLYRYNTVVAEHRARLAVVEKLCCIHWVLAVRRPGTWQWYRRVTLTLSSPITLRLYTLPYWSNSPFLIFDFPVLWRSVLSARAPESQKLKMMA